MSDNEQLYFFVVEHSAGGTVCLLVVQTPDKELSHPSVIKLAGPYDTAAEAREKKNELSKTWSPPY